MQHVDFFSPPCSGRSGAQSLGGCPFSTDRHSATKILWLLAPSTDSGHQEKPHACLRVVRLTEGATERSILRVRVGRRETIAALSHEHADPTPSVREPADFP